jgi:rhamnosyltransferase
VRYLHEKDNIGISKALNFAAGEALNAGFEWLLTMDQDSSFDTTEFTKYLNCLDQLDQKKSIGMVGVNYAKTIAANDNILEDVTHLITSGSILNLMIYKNTGPFDERLFIDEVDSEYCYRLRLKGFRVCVVKSCFMKHHLGQDIWVRNWLVGPKVQRNIHPPIRIYYMVRNFLLLNSIYKKEFPGEFKEKAKGLLNRLKNAILYSEKRSKVISFILRGIADYRKKKFGKFEGKN